MVADVRADIERDAFGEGTLPRREQRLEQRAQQRLFIQTGDEDLLGNEVAGENREARVPVRGAAREDPAQQATAQHQAERARGAAHVERRRRPHGVTSWRRSVAGSTCSNRIATTASASTSAPAAAS